MNTTPNPPAGPNSGGPHTISIVQNAACVVTGEACKAVYPGEFDSDAEAAEYAADLVEAFPWGWTCTCGLWGTGYATSKAAAFNAPDHHHKAADDTYTANPSTVVVVVGDGAST